MGFSPLIPLIVQTMWWCWIRVAAASHFPILLLILLHVVLALLPALPRWLYNPRTRLTYDLPPTPTTHPPPSLPPTHPSLPRQHVPGARRLRAPLLLQVRPAGLAPARHVRGG